MPLFIYESCPFKECSNYLNKEILSGKDCHFGCKLVNTKKIKGFLTIFNVPYHSL